MDEFERMDNINTVYNSLLHIEFELSQEPASYFRVAREAHFVLYRSMIEVLRGTANLHVTGRSKKDTFIYEIGREPRKTIHPVQVDGCQKAWRFSEPTSCAVPEPPEGMPFVRGPRRDTKRLIGLYDALAMVQAECFMHQWDSGGPVRVSDEDMRTIEWLHENVRNEYEHFIPKWWYAPKSDLAAACKLCLGLATALLFNEQPTRARRAIGPSNRIWRSESVDPQTLKARLDKLGAALAAVSVARVTG